MNTTHHDTRTPADDVEGRARRAHRRRREANAVALGGLVIFALNLLDLITTRFALLVGATEANPVMEPFADRWPLLVAVKVGLPALLAVFLWRRRTEATPALVTGVAILVVIYSVVVVVNLSHLV